MPEMNAIGLDVCLRGLANRGYTPAAVLDVGASDGNWTVRALAVWPRCRYFLIEALEERRPELEALKRNCDNVEYMIGAVGERCTRRQFAVTDDGVSSSFAYPGEEDYLLEVYRDDAAIRSGLAHHTLWRDRELEIRTVDDLLAAGRFPQPSFMKLDVQGYELNVLSGAERALAGCDLVLLEAQFFRFSRTMPLLHETIAFMAERRFYPYEIVDVLRRPHDGAMAQCDVLFCRDGHALNARQRWF